MLNKVNLVRRVWLMLLAKIPQFEAGIAESAMLPEAEFPDHAVTFYAIGRAIGTKVLARPKLGGTGPPGGFTGEPSQEVQDSTTSPPNPDQ